ncbi:MAG: hypothetical protein ACC630_00880 [Nitrospinota bacterium]
MTYWALKMLGYGNVGNYSPSWNEWGGPGTGNVGDPGSITDYPCTGTETGCDPAGDNICN